MSDAEKKRILIVDDEEEFVGLLKQRLEHEGYEVLAAYDGASAVEKMRNDGIDLVLLDIMMPGMDGFEVIERVRVEDGVVSKLPIVVITAYGSELDDEGWRIIGDLPLLRKPFEAGNLLEIISEKMAR